MKLLLTLVLVALASICAADDQQIANGQRLPQTLSISMPNDNVPYSYVDEQGKPQGFLVDYWRLWAEEANQKIQFIPSSFSQSLTAMTSGVAQIHVGLHRNELLMNAVEFLPKIVDSQAHLYTHRSSNVQQPLKSIGLVANLRHRNYLEKQFHNAKIKAYNSIPALLAAIKRGEIDGFLAESVSTWFELVKTLSFSEFIKRESIVIDASFDAAIAHDNLVLRQLVQQGMLAIPRQKKTALINKWLTNTNNVTKKGSTINHKALITLTDDERDWIQTNPVMTVGVVKNWPPFNFTSHKGESVGYNEDLVAQINTNINVNIVTKYYRSWIDIYDATVKGEVDGILSLSWSKERSEVLNYSPFYLYTPHYLVVKKSNTTIQTMEDLNGRTVSLFKNHLLNSILSKQLVDLVPVYVTSSAQASLFVQQGKAQATLIAHPNNAQLDKLGLKIVGHIFSKASEYAIGSSKHKPIFAQIITKGVNSLTHSQRQELRDKWLDPYKQHTFFSVEELAYLKTKPNVTIGSGDWRPIIFAESDGEISGIVGDFLHEITDMSGLKFTWVDGSWGESFDAFKQHSLDLLPAAYYSDERANFGLFSRDYFALSLSLFIREDDKYIVGFEQLSGKKLSILAGDSHIEVIKSLFPEIEIVTTNNENESINKLLNHDVDAIFEVEVIIQQALLEGLVQGISSVSQSVIPASPLHFLSKKTDPLLHSILDKSLAKISTKKREEIVQRWLRKRKSNGQVKVAFGRGRSPYVIENLAAKGIEFDIIKQVLAMDNIDIGSTNNYAMNKLINILDNNADVDIVVSVKAKKDQFFYSKNFISIKNVAITRADEQIKIDNVSELAEYSIIAFGSAHKYLGEPFRQLFGPQQYHPNYRENIDQQQQFDDFISGKANILIMGEDIFKWLARYQSLEQFSINSSLFLENSLQVGFRDESMRDTFDRNLARYKRSGGYQKVVDDYKTGMVIEKIEIASYIANLLGPFIYHDELNNIESVTQILTAQTHIQKIEIFDTNDQLIHTTSTQQLAYYNRFDSHYVVSGIVKNLGYVHVYFQETAFKKKIGQMNLIPSITLFKQHTRYRTIREVYKRLGYLDRQIEFNLAEKNYVKTHPLLSYAAIDWHPLSMVNKNQHEGLVTDYLALISQTSGLEFEFKQIGNWPKALQAFENKEVDFIPSVPSATQNELGIVSQSYARFNFVIAMNETASFVNSIEDLADATFVVAKGYSANNLVRKNYPNLKIIEVETTLQALMLVRKNEADAFIGHIVPAVNQLEQRFSDLKIVGVLDFDYKHAVMLHKNDLLLQSIFNKSIGAITSAQHQEIRNRWLKQNVNTAVDQRIIFQMITVFFAVLFTVLFFVNKLTVANRKLEDTIAELMQMQQQLIESEKMAGLGGLVAGVAHEINTPVGIGLTAVTHFQQTTKELNEKFKLNQISQQYFSRYLSSSLDAANIIQRNLERTAELVSSFKKVSVDQSSDEQRTFNVKEYLDEILVSISHITKNSHAKVLIDCNESLVIKSYPGALSQVVSNLLINATIHAYPNNEAGQITFTVTIDRGLMQLVYTDDGAGIATENLKKIFEPFFTTNREKGGSGLGLNIIYNIVTNQLGGTITCDSELGRGTQFTVKFKPN